ncbi:Fe2+-dependent dioxygenase [Mariniblastus sp.]|nr:Fe2+-dependent dioxygenase [Mariniblastus sp.]
MHVIQGVLSDTQLSEVGTLIDAAEFVDGKLTAGSAIAGRKSNLQLKRDGPDGTKLDQLILQALGRHPVFSSIVLPLRFSAPIISQYQPGMCYGTHVDAPFMGVGQPIRTDISVTLFLNDPTSYEGGELSIDLPGGARQVKLPAGDAIVYSTTAPHQVLPVTNGTRLVAVTWCQSRVRDAAKREILHDLHAVCSCIAEDDPDSIEAMLLNKSYSNLLRMFAET